MGGADRAFARFLAGHAASVVGSRMQAAALLWHVYTLTGSPVATGALGAAELVPLVALGTVGGVVADRWDRRRLLAWSQAGQALPALALAGLAWSGSERVEALYVAAAAAAALQGVDSAARKALVPRLVAPEGLASALSAVDVAKNVGKLAGPAAMGLLAASAGLGAVYLCNAASFFALIAALATLPDGVGAPGDAGQRPSLGAAWLDGARFALGSRVVRTLLLLDLLATLFAGAEALLPVVAARVLGVGAAGYGLLASASAGGALAAGLWLVASPPRRLGIVALSAVGAFGLATVGVGGAAGPVGCGLSLAALGAADTVSTVVRNTLVLLHTPDARQGRVAAVALVFSKTGPRVGQLGAGLVAAWLGTTASLVSGGAACVAAAGLVAWWHPWLLRLEGDRGGAGPR